MDNETPTPTTEPELSVVIPAYNESARLGGSLERILGYLETRGGTFDVMVVDDGSQDDTVEVAERFSTRGVTILRLAENRGKGAAVRHGVLASTGRRILFSDADLSTPIEDLARLEAQLGRFPVVLGSRAGPGSHIVQRQPLYRELMGKTFNQILRLAGLGSFRDTQCGFKLFDGAAGRDLFARVVTDGFAFDVEVVWLAERLGYGVTEIGVTWEDSPSSKVQPLLDPPKMLIEILRFRWRHRHLSLSASGRS